MFPEKLIRVRPMERKDVVHLMRWIGYGRREGVFQSGPIPDATAILRYHEKLRKSGWEYRCAVVEDGRRAIGYFDYRYRNKIGEILGLYLDPEFRGKRIGRHILRWIAADLRERNCREVRIEVYANNTVSLRACRAAGFLRDPKRDRQEDRRMVYGFHRSLVAFQRLSSLEPRYALLRGENLYLHHVAVAEVLSEWMSQIPGVEIVLGLGSLSRGFGDKWSDVDMAVIGRGSGLKRLWHGERWMAGLSVDLFVVDIGTDPISQWDDSRRQAFEESVVLFSRNASLIRSLQRSVRLGKRERDRKIWETLLKIGWLGFQPRKWYGRSKYGYFWSLPHDLWVQRGSVASAHATVDQAFDYALQLLFLTNLRHVPDPKWRRYMVSGLPWTPRHFGSMMDKVDQVSRDDRGFQVRAEATLSIIEQTVRHLERTGELRGNLYRSYLRNSPDYNPWVNARGNKTSCSDSR
jgi:ribosomal protein S18 acetylase RimI-like enzyme